MNKKMTKSDLETRIDVARGRLPCDLVLKDARWLDVFSGFWRTGDIAIHRGTIVGVGEKYTGQQTLSFKGKYLVPGFIDSHVHIESTMMVPEEFEATVLPRGTTSAILDPHEIANVLGKRGLQYILDCASQAQMDLFVMLSSCVPATHLETSGAQLNTQDLSSFRGHPKVLGLAEMMNYPGLLAKDPEVLSKIEAFQDTHIDGHAPMLRGRDLNAYLACGIKTCHESVSVVEAQEKLERGMQVMLREGSVAKNLRELVSVLTPFSSPFVSLCTDDRNPLDILDEGHIDHLIRLALKKGIAPHVVYRSASLSTAECFGIRRKGALAPGYDADIVVLKDHKKCVVDKVLKSGKLVEKHRKSSWSVSPPRENSMRCEIPHVDTLLIRNGVRVSAGLVNPNTSSKTKSPKNSSGSKSQDKVKVRVIGVIPNSIVTKNLSCEIASHDGLLHPDLKQDILKIAVLERHGQGRKPSVGFVKGMGFKQGAIGSSVGHDSHNAVVIGTNDADMITCFKQLKEMGGGFVVVEKGKVQASLALPIAGLMSAAPLKEIYRDLKLLRKKSKQLGCRLDDPFLQMAFLCLPVIPDLKITDLGLVDVNKFSLVSVVTPLEASL